MTRAIVSPGIKIVEVEEDQDSPIKDYLDPNLQELILNKYQSTSSRDKGDTNK